MNHHSGYGLLLALGLATGYGVLAAGSARPWSRWRIASFQCGCVLLMLAAVSDHDISFAGDMRQHLLVGMLAPTALVLGAPVTLFLRTAPVSAARRMGRLLRTRAVRVLAHPVTALALAIGPLPVLYLTDVYDRVNTNAALTGLLHLHFLVAGYLFAWALAGPDPAPRRPVVPARLLVLGAAVATHAVVSQALYAGAGSMSIPTADRQAGATVMYYGGDLAELILIAALVAGWRPAHAAARRTTADRPGRGGVPTSTAVATEEQ